MSMLMVFLGGGFGSLLRFGFCKLSYSIWNEIWPATCMVNILGSLTYLFLATRFPSMSPQYNELIKIGILGGLTTFSTFSYEIFLLVQKGQLANAVMVFGLNILFGVVMGIWIFGQKLV
ncbi:MAG: CrcB family protein [Bdellovibrio sp.]|nr:CrcB family protein [Bdellovibrio sp.]